LGYVKIQIRLFSALPPNKDGTENTLMHPNNFKEVEDGTPVIGALSFANGNCVVVIRLADGSWIIYDSKLDLDGPVWSLTAGQFHTLGRELSSARTLYIPEVLPIPLGGATLTITRCHGQFVWTLDTYPGEALTFTVREQAAFCYGYGAGQWPRNGPVSQIASYPQPHALASR
jgi:hypothetical protein